MSTTHTQPQPISSASVLAAWRQRVQAAPGQIALRLHRHGVWRSLNWAQFGHLVEDSVRMWQSLGVKAGAQVGLAGPLSEAALASVLALSLLNARAVLAQGVGLAQLRLDALLVDGATDLSTLPEQNWPEVVVVRAHEGVVRGHDSRLHFLDEVLAGLGEMRPGPVPHQATGPSESVLLSGLDSDQALQVLLQLWLTRAVVLALPEPRGDIHLVRQALQPTWVLDTPEGHAQLLSHVASRWPKAQSWRARLLASAFSASGRFGIKAWLRRRVLRQLGLAQTRVLLSDGEPSALVDAGSGRLGLHAVRLSHAWLAAGEPPRGSGLASAGDEHDERHSEISALRRAAS